MDELENRMDLDEDESSTCSAEAEWSNLENDSPHTSPPLPEMEEKFYAHIQCGVMQDGERCKNFLTFCHAHKTKKKKKAIENRDIEEDTKILVETYKVLEGQINETTDITTIEFDPKIHCGVHRKKKRKGICMNFLLTCPKHAGKKKQSKNRELHMLLQDYIPKLINICPALGIDIDSNQSSEDTHCISILNESDEKISSEESPKEFSACPPTAVEDQDSTFDRFSYIQQDIVQLDIVNKTIVQLKKQVNLEENESSIDSVDVEWNNQENETLHALPPLDIKENFYAHIQCGVMQDGGKRCKNFLTFCRVHKTEQKKKAIENRDIEEDTKLLVETYEVLEREINETTDVTTIEFDPKIHCGVHKKKKRKGICMNFLLTCPKHAGKKEQSTKNPKLHMLLQDYIPKLINISPTLGFDIDSNQSSEDLLFPPPISSTFLERESDEKKSPDESRKEFLVSPTTGVEEPDSTFNLSSDQLYKFVMQMTLNENESSTVSAEIENINQQNDTPHIEENFYGHIYCGVMQAGGKRCKELLTSYHAHNAKQKLAAIKNRNYKKDIKMLKDTYRILEGEINETTDIATIEFDPKIHCGVRTRKGRCKNFLLTCPTHAGKNKELNKVLPYYIPKLINICPTLGYDIDSNQFSEDKNLQQKEKNPQLQQEAVAEQQPIIEKQKLQQKEENPQLQHEPVAEQPPIIEKQANRKGKERARRKTEQEKLFEETFAWNVQEEEVRKKKGKEAEQEQEIQRKKELEKAQQKEQEQEVHPKKESEKKHHITKEQVRSRGRKKKVKRKKKASNGNQEKEDQLEKTQETSLFEKESQDGGSQELLFNDGDDWDSLLLDEAEESYDDQEKGFPSGVEEYSTDPQQIGLIREAVDNLLYTENMQANSGTRDLEHQRLVESVLLDHNQLEEATSGTPELEHQRLEESVHMDHNELDEKEKEAAVNNLVNILRDFQYDEVIPEGEDQALDPERHVFPSFSDETQVNKEEGAQALTCQPLNPEAEGEVQASDQGDILQQLLAYAKEYQGSGNQTSPSEEDTFQQVLPETHEYQGSGNQTSPSEEDTFQQVLPETHEYQGREDHTLHSEGDMFQRDFAETQEYQWREDHTLHSEGDMFQRDLAETQEYQGREYHTLHSEGDMFQRDFAETQEYQGREVHTLHSEGDMFQRDFAETQEYQGREDHALPFEGVMFHRDFAETQEFQWRGDQTLPSEGDVFQQMFSETQEYQGSGNQTSPSEEKAENSENQKKEDPIKEIPVIDLVTSDEEEENRNEEENKKKIIQYEKNREKRIKKKRKIIQYEACTTLQRETIQNPSSSIQFIKKNEKFDLKKGPEDGWVTVLIPVTQKENVQASTSQGVVWQPLLPEVKELQQERYYTQIQNEPVAEQQPIIIENMELQQERDYTQLQNEPVAEQQPIIIENTVTQKENVQASTSQGVVWQPLLPEVKEIQLEKEVIQPQDKPVAEQQPIIIENMELQQERDNTQLQNEPVAEQQPIIIENTVKKTKQVRFSPIVSKRVFTQPEVEDHPKTGEIPNQMDTVDLKTAEDGIGIEYHEKISSDGKSNKKVAFENSVIILPRRGNLICKIEVIKFPSSDEVNTELHQEQEKEKAEPVAEQQPIIDEVVPFVETFNHFIEKGIQRAYKTWPPLVKACGRPHSSEEKSDSECEGESDWELQWRVAQNQSCRSCQNDDSDDEVMQFILKSGMQDEENVLGFIT